MPSLNFKDKIEGDFLDLSLLTMKDVPVSEIAAIQKVRQLDLSNNEITSLPFSFAPSLGHIVKLDFARNKISRLPDNFGELHSLKHLDLYGNQLTVLPFSFENLKALRWLDVKGNPLRKDFAAAAGPCSDYQECQTAAKKLVLLCKKQRIAHEEQLALEEARRMEDEANQAAKRRAEEEQRLKVQKKKEAKAQKKLEKKLHKQAAQTVENGTTSIHNSHVDTPSREVSHEIKNRPLVKEKSGAFSCLAWVNIVLSILLLFACGLCFYMYSEGDISVSGSYKAFDKLKENGKFIMEVAKPYWTSTSKATVSAFRVAQNNTVMFSRYIANTVKNFNPSRDLNFLQDFVKAAGMFASFLWDQMLVIYEELRRNEALKGIFEYDFSNLKETFREWSNIFMEFVLYIQEVVSTKCIPAIENQFSKISEWVRSAIN